MEENYDKVAEALYEQGRIIALGIHDGLAEEYEKEASYASFDRRAKGMLQGVSGDLQRRARNKAVASTRQSGMRLGQRASVAGRQANRGSESLGRKLTDGVFGMKGTASGTKWVGGKKVKTGPSWAEAHRGRLAVGAAGTAAAGAGYGGDRLATEGSEKKASFDNPFLAVLAGE